MTRRFHGICRWVSAALAAAFVLAGCAIKPSVDVSTASSSGFELRDLYIYSFLDVRQTNLGPKYLAEFERQLGDALEKRRVRSRQLWFSRSEMGRHTAMMESVSSVYPRRNSSLVVPVKGTVEENVQDEVAFGARYRMILFPKQIADQNYTVHVDIYDVATGRLVWYATMQGRNFNWVVGDEVPEQRASLAVQSLMEAFDGSKLFPIGAAAPVPPAATQAAPNALADEVQARGSYEQMKLRYADRLARQRAAQSVPPRATGVSQ